jgi:membrane-associated protease RseP (regulator of RpoE activity)
MSEDVDGDRPPGADDGSLSAQSPPHHQRDGAEERPPRPADPVYVTSPTRTGLLIGAIVVLGLLASWSMVVTILGVVVMITLHELGHFLAAKWAGMKVTEFFIGFGPRIWSVQRGETEYGIKPIPAGAYVRIIGMSNLDEVEPTDEARSYRQQSFPKRLAVVLAGPATHFVQALVIIFVLLTVAGIPGGSLLDRSPELWQIREVTPDSAADAAGLGSEDRIVAFNGEPVATFAELTDHIRSTQVGEEVTLTVERDGEQFDTTTEIGGRPADATQGGSPPRGSPFLGVDGGGYQTVRVDVLEGLRETPQQTAEVAWESVLALGRFFSPSGIGNFADTVSQGRDPSSDPGTTSGGGASDEEPDDGRLLSIYGAVRIGAALGEQSWAGLLVFFLTINIFVGLINLVPLLPFDGGHAAVAIYERLRSRRGQRYYADATKLLPIAYAVVMVLVVLFVTTLYLDIVNPIEL